jgi:hypothetical protein
MRGLALASLVGLTLLAGRDLCAQDPNAPAAFATVNLSGGFLPDPNVTSLTAGGGQRVNVGGCTYGYVASAPDVKLHYAGNNQRTLYIYATSNSDVTLLVNLPNGSWRCDDDSFGSGNPLLIIPRAPSGRYDIWVGTYGQSTAPAQLMISEIDPRSGGRPMPAPSPAPAPVQGGGGINPSLPAAYATRNLSGGFLPDPDVTSLTAGGGQRVNVGGCTYGYVASAPDVKLHYAGNNQRTLYIYATAGSDITLLINMPDGSWRCDDDSFGSGNPILVFPNAPSGRYDIWVGTYGQNTAPAQLMISEINPRR